MKIKTTLAILIAAYIMATPARAFYEVLTVEGGVACLNPRHLNEATIAVSLGDDKWTSELHCMRLREGVPGIWINTDAALNYPWQVRLMPRDEPGVTVWGPASSFKTKWRQ